MQGGHDHFGRGFSFLRVRPHRNPPAVIGDRDRFIGVDNDLYFGTIAGQGFINAVINHFKNHVVQAGPVIRISDIHAGAFLDRIKPL